MASESGSSQEWRWLVEPPGPQEVTFQLMAGDQVEITPEVRQAFDSLVEALSAAEVEGYIGDDCLSFVKGCTTNAFTCNPRRKCTQEYQIPNCLIDYGCKIAQIG